MQSGIFLRHVAVPQDHGSWVFILSPLLIGLFAGNTFFYASFNLIVAALAAFMLRQPATMLVKIMSGRRGKDDLTPARFWFGVYLFICALAILALVLEGFGYVIYLAVPGALIFGWHLYLVSQRDERRQAGVEIVATGALSLAAPAAYWIGIGDYDHAGWLLWILIWMQTAASIVYAYLRLDQRNLDHVPDLHEKWKMGRRAAIYTTFNL
ncbi:MAG TPA: YwiC-like family protein, partial [Anaerolineales bacterium]|nr:YwiC-like family protein [Anaerolineales bacterium]